MPRPTTNDGIIFAALQAVANIAALVTYNSVAVAAYPRLGLPFPQEPFPSVYSYDAGIAAAKVAANLWRYELTVVSRMLGGDMTVAYRFNPEDAVETITMAYLSELAYRPFLQDPTTGAAFAYMDPKGELVPKVGRIQVFKYETQGGYIGKEVTMIVPLLIQMPRIS